MQHLPSLLLAQGEELLNTCTQVLRPNNLILNKLVVLKPATARLIGTYNIINAESEFLHFWSSFSTLFDPFLLT
jgi:hypothetical protein